MDGADCTPEPQRTRPGTPCFPHEFYYGVPFIEQLLKRLEELQADLPRREKCRAEKYGSEVAHQTLPGRTPLEFRKKYFDEQAMGFARMLEEATPEPVTPESPRTPASARKRYAQEYLQEQQKIWDDAHRYVSDEEIMGPPLSVAQLASIGVKAGTQSPYQSAASGGRTSDKFWEACEPRRSNILPTTESFSHERKKRKRDTLLPSPEEEDSDRYQVVRSRTLSTAATSPRRDSRSKRRRASSSPIFKLKNGFLEENI